jgi:hypothetical protein
MFPHQLGQDFILALDLLLQVLDTFLLGLVVAAAFGLEGDRPILEEFLLPAVNNNSSGIAVASLCLALALAGQTCPSGLGVNPIPDGNQITGNRAQGNGKVPTGIPILDALEADLVWDGAGTGNCWSNNIFGTSVPPPSLLPACH